MILNRRLLAGFTSFTSNLWCPLRFDGTFGDVCVEGHQPTTPVTTSNGMLTLPMTMNRREADREHARQSLNFLLFHPRLWKRLQLPWYRWMPSAMLAAM